MGCCGAVGVLRGLVTNDEREAVAALARGAVAESAPHELPLFRATSEAYWADPERTLAGGDGAKDEMLGFGVEAALMFVTPAALEVAKAVVAFVAARVRASAEREGGRAVDDAVAHVLRRIRGDGGGETQKMAALTDEQLDEVRRLAVEKARQLDLPEDKASLLADALVGRLATV